MANGRQDQQHHGRGPGEAVHHAHDKRSHELIDAQLPKPLIQADDRDLALTMTMSCRLVPVGMAVYIGPMPVRMGVRVRPRHPAQREGFGDPSQDTHQVQYLEHDQRHGARELHRQTHPPRDHAPKMMIAPLTSRIVIVRPTPQRAPRAAALVRCG